MRQSGSPEETALSDAQSNFAGRLPSQLWERMSIADGPEHFVWVWIKPASLPQGFIVNIPDETYRTYPGPDRQLTMRKILQAAGVEPVCVSMWHLNGAAYEGLNGTSPLLDAAVPAPLAGVDPSIIVHTILPQAVPVQPPLVPVQSQVIPVQPHIVPVQQHPGAVPPYVGAEQPQVGPPQHLTGSVGASTLTEMFERIDSDWCMSVEMERNLARLRRRLQDLTIRLKALNRDLSSPERLYASNQDKKDWLEARRWLRSSEMQLTRCIKDLDIGDTSSAGNRKSLEKTYEEFIVPRREFPGMVQSQREFESHRKMVNTLQVQMNTAYSSAEQDGERRAQRILRTIQQKVREGTMKKNFLDVMFD